MKPELAVSVVDLAVVARHTDVADFEITVLSSADGVKALEVEEVASLGVQNVDHPRCFDFEGQRLENDVVTVELRKRDEAVGAAVVSEDVGQLRLAELALVLLPGNARVVGRLLAVLLRFEPVLQTVVVNEFDSTPALADLQQRVVFAILIHPANTTLRLLIRNDAHAVIADLGVLVDHSLVVAQQIAKAVVVMQIHLLQDCCVEVLLLLLLALWVELLDLALVRCRKRLRKVLSFSPLLDLVRVALLRLLVLLTLFFDRAVSETNDVLLAHPAFSLVRLLQSLPLLRVLAAFVQSLVAQVDLVVQHLPLSLALSRALFVSVLVLLNAKLDVLVHTVLVDLLQQG